MLVYIGDIFSAVDMTFTSKNLQRALCDVNDPEGLGDLLGVPDSKQNEIRSQFSSVPQRTKAFVDYFMEHDPLASWRAVIVFLDAMREKKAADAIRHLAEPITGTCTCSMYAQHYTCTITESRTTHEFDYFSTPFLDTAI